MVSSSAEVSFKISRNVQTTPLKRIVRPSVKEMQCLIAEAKPAVFTQDPAELLTPGDLSDVLGDRPVLVSASTTGAFRHQPDVKTQAKEMPFSDFAAYIECASGQSGERLYLSQFPIDAAPAVLRPGIAVPSYVPEDASGVTRNLWFGPAGTISPLHFDRSHNLLHQHYGRKHIVIVHPSEFRLDTAGAKNSASPHVSSLDLVDANLNIDLPLLDAPNFDAILEPGDILLLPALWWHNVVSLEASISVNYWWRPPLSACLYPNFFRMLSSRTIYDDPSVIAQWADLGSSTVSSSLCLSLAKEGHLFAAAALAGAMVSAFCRRFLRMIGQHDSHPMVLAPNNSGLPDFAGAATAIPILKVQGLIGKSQSEVLLQLLDVAAETAAAPEPLMYNTERSAELLGLITRFNAEFGDLRFT
jgi:lysine-specific demethylase 8